MQSDVDRSQVDQFIKWTEGLDSIQYKLGEKDMGLGYGDCSALLSWYGYIDGLWSFKSTQTTLNAYNLYKMGQETDGRYGDIVFFWNRSGGVHHIGVLTNKAEGGIEIVDLSGKYNVSKRWIEVEDGKYITDGEEYTIHYSTNVLFHDQFTKQKMATINGKDFYVKYRKDNIPKEFEATITTYIIPEIDDPTNINCGGSSCRTTANGTVLSNELAGKIGACPMQYPIGTKLNIEGHGNITCVDRGGLIVMRNDINTRGNVSTMNRIDVFAGVGSSQISLSKSVRNVKIY